MVPNATTRRRFLALAAAGTGALAGCGDSGDGDDGDGGTPTAGTPTDLTATATPTVTTSAPPATATPTPTRTTAPGTTTPVPEERYEAVVRTFLQRLVAGEYEAAREPFDATMREQVPANRLGTIWEQVTADRGQFVEVAEVGQARSGEFVVVDLLARFTNGTLLVRVPLRTVDAEPRLRIAGLQFPPQSTGSYSPPAYADPATFTEETLSLDAQGCPLGATLTRPDGPATVPGVVLVHGSGPNDRDETIGPNKPFRDLAWGLATRGVAVLRYDKRTSQCEVPPADFTLDRVVADDALVALDRLRSADGVRTDGVSVVGHSLGGMAAPRIAARDGDLAGAALLAANARPLHRLIPDQYEYLFRLDGSLSASEEAQLADVRAAAGRVDAGEYEPGEAVLGFPGAFWTSVADYDQVATATSLPLPRFLAQGGRDYQVPPDTEFGRWQDALGDDPAATLRTYPALNHLLIPGEGQPTPAEYQRPGNVGEALVADLAAWVESAAGPA